jgi:hypothetical protein
MGKGDYGIQSGGKGYKPPYPGHEAMCVVKQGIKGSGNPKIGSNKVTEGNKPDLLNQVKASGKKPDKTQAAKVAKGK